MGMKVAKGVLMGAVVLTLSACGREEPAVSEPAGQEPADAPETADAAPQDRPELREGLWVLVSETDGMRAAMRMCVDAEVQEKTDEAEQKAEQAEEESQGGFSIDWDARR